MKKQMFILSAIALVTASAQACPLFKSEQMGTQIDMTIITDEVKQTDLGNTLSLRDGLLVGS